MKRNFLDKLLVVTNTKVCFTLDQYKSYEKGEISLTNVYLTRNIDREIAAMNPKMYRFIVVTLAMTMFFMEATIIKASAEGLDGIDSLGFTMLKMFQNIGYWIAIIMCLKEIFQCMMKGGKCTEEIFGIITKYAIIFGSLFLVPILFDAIRKAFLGL